MFKTIASVLGFGLLFIFSFAQDELATYTLTTKDVQNFINEFPSIRTEFERLDVDYEDENFNRNILADTAAYSEINQVLSKHGYTDYFQFIGHTTAIAMAYASIIMNSEDPDNQENFESALAEIRANNDMSEEQKEQLIQIITQSAGVMGNMSSAENMEAVRPYLSELKKLFNEMNE